MHNPEDLNAKGVAKKNLDVTEDPLSEEELAELGDKYQIRATPSNVSIAGAAILAGALSMGAPEEVNATPLAGPEARVQPESAERRNIVGGKIEHPELGKMDFMIYDKPFDRNNPVFPSIGVVVNGEEVVVKSGGQLRNGTVGAIFLYKGKEISCSSTLKKAECEIDGVAFPFERRFQ
jgi:hypothetical protein